ncbi:MAG: hypothetical protein IMZ66_12065, partial [Planctomycetes bacterium]|nr:hypothetical protein [Planctomycetota bacterium]
MPSVTTRRRVGRFSAMVVLAPLAAAMLAGCGGDEPAPLRCYVGGTMRPAVEEIVQRYREETATAVELDYGDSGANFIKVDTTRRGDLY